MMELKNSSLYTVIAFGFLSFTTAILLMILLYTACNRKYRLNWFEKNLLESLDANDSSCRRLNGENEDASDLEGEQFWVPPKNAKAQSGNQESNEGSNSPKGSVDSSPALQPVAGNDNIVVLSTTTPARPKIASMQSVLDHTKIDSALYQTEDSPGSKEDSRGSIHITVAFDTIAEILTVKLVEAHDLQARDFNGTADPYAKIRLLPDRTNVWQTKIHKKTLNPIFDEDFVFEVPGINLTNRILEIIVYDFDAYSRHHSIGGIRLPLCDVNFAQKLNVWKSLLPVCDKDPSVDLGELMVSFSYLPTAERLTVVVVKARNLRVVDDTRTTSDPFVKVSLYDGNRKVKRRKTSVKRNTVCPVFNEAFTFNIDKQSFKKSYIEFMVLHDSLLSTSELLGKCRVGSFDNKKSNIFTEVLQTKSAVARWLPLTDS